MKWVHFTEKPEQFKEGLKPLAETFDAEGGLFVYRYNPDRYDEMAAGWGRSGIVIESDDAELYQESPLGDGDYDEYIIYPEDFENAAILR